MRLFGWRKDPKAPPKNKRRLLIMGVLILIVLAAGTYFLWHKVISPPPKTPLHAALAEEKTYDKGIDNQLAGGDVMGYEASKLQQANLYMQLNDYGNAGAILDEISKNVPQKDLTQSYYLYLIELDKHNNDTKAEKQAYTELLALLKSENSPQYKGYLQQYQKL